MKRKQSVFLSSRRKQGGFLLAQLAIALTLISMVAAYYGHQYWTDTINKARDDKARLVGAVLANISDGTKTYATTFFTQIQQAQAVTRNGYTVPAARVLTPTTADLNGLGFLASKAVNPIVYNGQSIGFTIQLTVDTSSGCTVPTCNLPFQVTTTIPLIDPSTNQVDVRRATIAATTASPGNAGVAMPTSFGGNPNIFVTQGGTQTGTNPGGVAGLVSMSNGYDSQGFFQFDRRDGSLPRTGDINMQDTAGAKHNINNAGTVNADTTNTGTLYVSGLAVEGTACSKLGLIAANSSGKLLACNGSTWGKATDMPNAHRYVFTATSNWTVPTGVKSALVTMAGGGASGYGWRLSNNYSTGSTGGFVFSAPVNLVAGETMSVIVGKGGPGYGPVNTGVLVPNTPGYTVYGPPSGDDGLGGYPGGITQLVSPSQGVLLECDGGSGASAGGVDSYTGQLVPGPQNGAVSGSGRPVYSSPNRVASGPYVTGGGPGACGYGSYGVGNWGQQSWNMASGSFPGAATPFGYGSGGAVNVSGCYVSTTDMGICIWSNPGRDGVVMIDVLY